MTFDLPYAEQIPSGDPGAAVVQTRQVVVFPLLGSQGFTTYARPRAQVVTLDRARVRAVITNIGPLAVYLGDATVTPTSGDRIDPGEVREHLSAAPLFAVVRGQPFSGGPTNPPGSDPPTGLLSVRMETTDIPVNAR